jgi:hypothetical protein
MSLTTNNVVATNLVAGNETINNFTSQVTPGVSGQILQSNGTSIASSWLPPSPFNQAVLNTTDSPTFASLTVGSAIMPNAAGSAPQYLQSQGSSNAVWTIPKKNVQIATLLSGLTPTTSGSVSTKNWTLFTGLSVTITPLFTTSKILLMVNLGGVWSANTNVICFATIFKNGSDLSSNAGLTTSQYYGANGNYPALTFSYLDSPSTTSATTYAVYICNCGPGSATFNQGNATASIIAYEV